MDIRKLIEESVGASPDRLSQIAVELSALYANLSEQLENILVFKPERWLEIRKSTKSDSSTDRAWDATPEGLNELRLKLQLKRVEKVVSSIKVRLRVKEGESFGRF